MNVSCRAGLQGVGTRRAHPVRGRACLEAGQLPPQPRHPVRPCFLTQPPQGYNGWRVEFSRSSGPKAGAGGGGFQVRVALPARRAACCGMPVTPGWQVRCRCCSAVPPCHWPALTCFWPPSPLTNDAGRTVAGMTARPTARARPRRAAARPARRGAAALVTSRRATPGGTTVATTAATTAAARRRAATSAATTAAARRHAGRSAALGATAALGASAARGVRSAGSAARGGTTATVGSAAAARAASGARSAAAAAIAGRSLAGRRPTAGPSAGTAAASGGAAPRRRAGSGRARRTAGGAAPRARARPRRAAAAAAPRSPWRTERAGALERVPACACLAVPPYKTCICLALQLLTSGPAYFTQACDRSCKSDAWP